MRTKEYKLPNGRTAVFEYDEYGIGKVTLEAMDSLMEMIGANDATLDVINNAPTILEAEE